MSIFIAIAGIFIGKGLSSGVFQLTLIGLVICLIYLLFYTRFAFRFSVRYQYLLQLSSYQLDGYFKSAKRTFKTDWLGPILMTVLCIVLEVFCTSMLLFPALRAGMVGTSYTIIFGVVALILPTYYFLHTNKQDVERFAQTDRILRLQKTNRTLTILCSVMVLAAAIVLNLNIPWDLQATHVVLLACCAALLYLPTVLQPFIVALSAKLREKAEEKINKGYSDHAKKIIKLRQNDLTVVGITGSYGKTSTKFILGDLLKEKYNVMVPPSSYNTPMGLTLVIREMLDFDHEVLLAEMGARRVGEIKELCEIAQPKYGIITSIGPQHLETFKNIETVASTKYELAQSLPEDGVAFFAADNSYCEQLYHKHTGNKRLYGIEGEALFMRAENITVSSSGSAFDLTCNGESVHCSTVLLGKHNIVNIAGSAAVAFEMGLSMQEIATGISHIKPIEHRLQLIDAGTGVLVIDDAFNSNPAGAKAALDVLDMFEGRKICVTPGMIELGKIEFEENKKFGAHMANVCDIVILVGHNRAIAMQEGLNEAGFQMQFCFVAQDLDEASAILSHLTQVGDIVLFENDLPSNYNE